MAGVWDISKSAKVKSDVVTDIFEAIFNIVRSGESVKIPGFGSFEKKQFPGRTVTSPVINDGEPTTFGPTFRIAFHQSTQCKRRLNRIIKKGKNKSGK